MAFFTALSHRALVAVGGDDRASFLQGMISNDMRRVEAGRAMWAAFLTAQGKFLHEFFVVPHRDVILLECERARREDLIARLARYKLRSKVTFAPLDTLDVGVAWGAGAATALETADGLGTVKERGDGVLYTDPRLEGAGVRTALTPEQAGQLSLDHATAETYDAHRITLGLPDGSRDMEVDKALLLENGFEELHGVDFEKGCYIGQELTARTHYRALIKKRLMPVTIDGATPAPGEALTVDGRDAGEMKSIAGIHGLALVRLDAWKAGGNLTAGAARITPVKPDWMQLPQDE
ncbi:MAG: folate-binding protein [Proteobacteria bacterium]|nr:folate-binding protein [Pseudomonadota bacterium]